MQLPLIKNRFISLTLSGVLVLLSMALYVIWGLHYGIDFTGGSLLEVSYETQRPSIDSIRGVIEGLQIADPRIQLSGDAGIIIRLSEIDEATHQQILQVLNTQTEGQGVIEDRFDSVGPTVGKELQQKALWALYTVLLAIVLYVTWAFRKVSKPIASWTSGVVTLVTLFHDVLIVVGVFVFLGKYLDIEVDTAFITALLTILGYSVNDTIVVFDRIRENLHKHFIGSSDNFEELVNDSVNQTLARSINTSLTVALVLLAIFFVGGTTVHYFVLALIIGVVVGTYSSIFLASPLLVELEKLKK